MLPSSKSASKRKRDGDETGPNPTKKAKLLEESLLSFKTCLPWIKTLERLTEGYLRAKFSVVVSSWERVIESLEQGERSELEYFPLLTEALPEDVQKSIAEDRLLREQWESAVKSNKDLQHAIEQSSKIRPRPSSYARDWTDPQDAWGDILCLRPTKRQGLPLCTLHDAFRLYSQDRDQPLPNNELAFCARRAAEKLCYHMGNAYDTPEDHSQAFNKSVAPLFPLTAWRSTVLNPKAERLLDECRVGFSVKTFRKRSTKIERVLREDTREIGDSGDPFVHAARDFHLWVQTIQEQDSAEARALLSQGAPVFIMNVTGPLLGIAGAFFDGKVCTVEPLGSPLWMLEDSTKQRQEDVSRALYALARGIEALEELSVSNYRRPSNQNTTTFTPGVPRIYRSADPEDLTFTLDKPFLFNPLSMFTGQGSFGSDTFPIFAKMVPKSYGMNVHVLLANHGYAPRLFGKSSLAGAPTLYVMEFLQDRDGWMTLYDFEDFLEEVDYSHPDETRTRIRTALDAILSLLKANDMVHGDLRSNNIMIQCDQDRAPLLDGGDQVSLKVIDFDWAGEAGKVSYSPLRNDDLQWPAKIGEPILPKHDRELVNYWCSTF
ncbi:hypothetical protein ONZ45_g1304 [Pleurotus djamor]|nr:hypothetical protein ONZ45_g1304 [Pleurotus djamor]